MQFGLHKVYESIYICFLNKFNCGKFLINGKFLILYVKILLFGISEILIYSPNSAYFSDLSQSRKINN